MTEEEQKEVIAILRRGWDRHVASFEMMAEEDEEFLLRLAGVLDSEDPNLYSYGWLGEEAKR